MVVTRLTLGRPQSSGDLAEPLETSQRLYGLRGCDLGCEVGVQTSSAVSCPQAAALLSSPMTRRSEALPTTDRRDPYGKQRAPHLGHRKRSMCFEEENRSGRIEFGTGRAEPSCADGGSQRGSRD